MIFVSNPCNSLILGYLIPIVGLPIIPLMILAYPVLGRHFDPRIHHRESLDFWLGPIGKYIARPIAYAFFIVVNVDWNKLEERATRRNPDVNPMGPTIRTYGHIDFRSEATISQQVLSWFYVLLLFMWALLSFVYGFCTYLL